MRPYSPPAELLADIEQRQDDLLIRLDELNAHIEQVLAEMAPPKSAEEVAA